MFMKSLSGFVIISIFAATECKPSTLDVGNNCVALYLKDQKKLEEDFPTSVDIDASKCRLVMPIIIKAFEAALCSKLLDHKSVKADCVVDKLKSEGALEYMLMQEVILMTKGLEEDDMKMRIEDIKEKLRNIFEDAAKVCESDPTYAGLFDDILEIKNESLSVLRQNYCFTKFVIESKLIDVDNIEINPKKIATSNIDCQTLIKNNRIEREKKLLDTLKTRNLSKDQTQCIIDKFQIERAFDSNLALEVLDQLDITLEEKRINREKIAKQLENFIKAVFMCAGRVSGNHKAKNSSEPISIMHF
ncbi:CLUMA_CG016114, isoform A [Clunio marinus]|uniref:CLUMA_CG016114, isoform A n=1 Tax=Clunio marinus TaxID=568069 RepID=A0A1J1IRA7_9DIPT|nr:CLUMA_CG016114, isoform A [Clunio marinus]